MSKLQPRLAALMFVCAISGCGGGGGGGAGPAPNPGPSGDTSAPQTDIAEALESGIFESSSMTFTPTSNETGVTYEGSLDGGAFATITVPWELSGLADGEHTVAIRARDAAGNVDATPFMFEWRVDTATPGAVIAFPVPASYTTARSITVRGTGSGLSKIASISVNGTEATTTDDYQTWSSIVDLSRGGAITVTVTDTLGRTELADTAVVGTGQPLLNSIGGMDYDPTEDRIVVSDTRSNAVYAFHTVSGDTTAISANGSMGAVDLSGRPGPLVVDAANNRALVVDTTRMNLTAIDLATGSRTLISGSGGDADSALAGAIDIALDAANNRVFVACRSNASIVQVDLTTGMRTVIASPTIGTGEALGIPATVAYDDVTIPVMPRLLVSQSHVSANPRLIQIDIATGERTTLEPSSPSDVPFAGASSMKLDAANRRLVILDYPSQQLVAVDLGTGDRTLLSGSARGSGEAIAASVGLALKSSTDTVFIGQTRGEVLAAHLQTGVRSTLVHSRFGVGERMSDVLGLAIEQRSGPASSLLVTEVSSDRLTRIDLTSGNRTIVSDSLVGSGTSSLATPVDVVMDTRASVNGSAALVLLGSGGDAIVSVDLATGARTRRADLSGVNRPWSLVLDSARNRVLFTDQNSAPGAADALYAVDLASGIRTEISGPNEGAGPELIDAGDLVLESAANPTRVTISDPGQRALMSVDLATGARNDITLSGPADFFPGPLFFDTEHNQLIGFDAAGGGSLFRRDAAGTISTISGLNSAHANIGKGPLLGYVQGLDVDAANRIAFVADVGSNAVLAVDLMTAERVIVSH